MYLYSLMPHANVFGSRPSAVPLQMLPPLQRLALTGTVQNVLLVYMEQQGRAALLTVR